MDMIEKKRNAIAMVALIQSKISGKLYLSLILDGNPYKYWDLDSLGPAGINFCTELMKAYDYGYDIQTQFPSKVDGLKKIVPIEFYIKDEPNVNVSQNNVIMNKISQIRDAYTDTGNFYSESDKSMEIAKDEVTHPNNPSNNEIDRASQPPENSKIEEKTEPSRVPNSHSEESNIPQPIKAEPKPEPPIENVTPPASDIDDEEIKPVVKHTPTVSELLNIISPDSNKSDKAEHPKQESKPITTKAIVPEPAITGKAIDSIPKVTATVVTKDDTASVNESPTKPMTSQMDDSPKPTASVNPPDQLKSISDNQPSADNWVCSHGHTNIGSFRFCADCGEARVEIKASAPEPWVCSHGHENPPIAKFCCSCGEPKSVKPNPTLVPSLADISKEIDAELTTINTPVTEEIPEVITEPVPDEPPVVSSPVVKKTQDNAAANSLLAQYLKSK